MKKLILPLSLLLTIACANEPAPVEAPVREESIAEAPVAFNDKAVKIIEKKNVEYAYPRWSKDGSKILFQSNETGRWQINVMNSDGSNIVPLTKDSSNNNFIDWSRDNKRIAFVSDRSGNEEIWVMDADGKNIKQLTFDNARNIHPYWSPDGKSIFFNSDREGNLDIYKMTAEGKNVTNITNTPNDDETCARLSDNSNKLLFLRNNIQGLDDIFLMDLSDSSAVNITNTYTTDGWPCWVPGTNEFVYSAIDDNIYKLFRYNLDNKTIEKLSEPPSLYFDARADVSADGSKIVFNRQMNGARNTIGIYVLQLPLPAKEKS